jgi:hypothetical protein
VGGGKEHRSFVGSDILEDLTDIGHHQDVCAPYPEDRIHEDVPLGTVIDGQGIDIDVVLVVLAVDDSSHVLGHESLIADDDPLGQGFRAAGIGHLAGVLDMEDDVRFRVGIFAVPGVEILETVVCPSLPRHLIGPDEGLYRGHVVHDVLNEIEKGVFDNEYLAFRVIDTIGDVFSPEEIVDRQIDRTDLCTPEPGEDMVDCVVGQDGDPVIFLNPQGRQGVGRPVAFLFQFGVGQSLIPVNKGRLVRVMIGAPADHVGDDPAVHLNYSDSLKIRDFPC